VADQLGFAGVGHANEVGPFSAFRSFSSGGEERAAAPEGVPRSVEVLEELP